MKTFKNLHKIARQKVFFKYQQLLSKSPSNIVKFSSKYHKIMSYGYFNVSFLNIPQFMVFSGLLCINKLQNYFSLIIKRKMNKNLYELRTVL